VRWGRAWEEGGAPAFWPGVQVLQSCIAERDDEDLHRADTSSLRLLQFLAESWTAPGSWPPEPTEGDAAPSSTPVSVLRERIGGNPFFVDEMVRLLARGGQIERLRPSDDAAVRVPEAVRDVVRERLIPLGQRARMVLELASVIGQEFGLTVLECVAGPRQDALLDALDQAADIGLIAADAASAEVCLARDTRRSVSRGSCLAHAWSGRSGRRMVVKPQPNRNRRALREVVAWRRSQRAARAGSTRASGVRMGDGPSRVLVVEDDVTLSAVVEHALVDEGYAVRRAGAAAEALAIVRVWRPDLILLDVELPGPDGWAFRRAQRALPGAASVPVVVMSGSRRLMAPSPELIPAAVMTKPFRLGDLLAIVGRLAVRLDARPVA
jgi:CheY-like chemotaxis protein